MNNPVTCGELLGVVYRMASAIDGIGSPDDRLSTVIDMFTMMRRVSLDGIAFDDGLRVPCVTQWFTGKPRHVGAYELNDAPFNRTFAYWDGARWGMLSASPKGAALLALSTLRHGPQYYQWRGVTA